MKLEHAIEWLRGERSSWNQHATCGEDTRMACVTCAQEDAAHMQQAYWMLRAHKEGLVQEQPKDSQ